MTHFFFLNYKASSTTLYFCFNNKQKSFIKLHIPQNYFIMLDFYQRWRCKSSGFPCKLSKTTLSLLSQASQGGWTHELSLKGGLVRLQSKNIYTFGLIFNHSSDVFPGATLYRLEYSALMSLIHQLDCHLFVCQVTHFLCFSPSGKEKGGDRKG